MDLTKITLSAACASEDILFTVMLDGHTVYHGHLAQEPQLISIELNDSEERDRCLSLTMSGKTLQHTKIDDQGNIQQDAVITVSDLAFDGIQLGHLVVEKSIYHHDFNGTQQPIEDKFYGTMGCNGTVKLDFYSPVYLWLLENM